MVGWLVGWLVGCLVAWLLGCLVAWLLGCLVVVGCGWLWLVVVGCGWCGWLVGWGCGLLVLLLPAHLFFNGATVQRDLEVELQGWLDCNFQLTLNDYEAG